MIPIWFGFVSLFKERDVQLQAFHLSRSAAISFLLPAERNWKLTTVSPLPPFPPRSPFSTAPAVPHFSWQNLVLDLIGSWCYSLITLIVCLQFHDLLHVCYRTGKAPALLAPLRPLLAALDFHSCLPQISNGYLQVLAELLLPT